MCNINALFSLKENPHKMSFMQSVTSSSFLYNSDGDGIYFNDRNKVFKSKDKLDLLKYADYFKESDIILSHQRYATHGKTEEYTQPFKTNNFIFLHNGILHEYTKGEKSDSYNFLINLEEIFIKNLNEMKFREDALILSIKELLEGKDTGSYSIIIYDIINKQTYYFKNSQTNIHFYKSKNHLYLTTCKNNNKFLNIMGEKFKEINIKDNKIIKITLSENKINIKSIAKIKQLIIVTPESKYNYEYFKPSMDYLKDEVESLSYDSPYFANCIYCSTPTYRVDKKLNSYICDMCKWSYK